jgi:hypothetical protein
MIRSLLSFVFASSVFIGPMAIVGAQLASSPFGELKAPAHVVQAEAKAVAASIVSRIALVPLIRPDSELNELAMFFPENELAQR